MSISKIFKAIHIVVNKVNDILLTQFLACNICGEVRQIADCNSLKMAKLDSANAFLPFTICPKVNPYHSVQICFRSQWFLIPLPNQAWAAELKIQEPLTSDRVCLYFRQI